MQAVFNCHNQRVRSCKLRTTKEKQQDDPPRFIRLQQLKVLLELYTPETFKADEFALGIDNLLKGKFIMLRDKKVYDNVFQTMDSVITSIDNPPKKREGWRLYYLQYHYTDIIEYKKLINKVLNHNDGVIEVSYTSIYSVIMTNTISKKIDTKPIDDFLCSVIDPWQRAYTKENLIETFNYPKENLFDIDTDYYLE